ncbi:hypothetical protein ENSA5_66780 [Enhygromyxa salina]|uniref:Small-conductance mechanosensitive channel n=1 Tax=Enhygromyxa salina TaxID=215803 RepID=A0A2S9XBI1_9BACT|nr:mechanosensitive ion channel [Enhygromyxa salina]PRP90217.1 hypothetical protein ENSA5_66780 [Enhygromyxa salina]
MSNHQALHKRRPASRWALSDSISRFSLAGAAALIASLPALALAAPPEEAAPAQGAETTSNVQAWVDYLGQFVNDDIVQIGLNAVLAILLFIGGWFVAKLISWVVYRALLRTDVDNRLAKRLGLDLLSDKDEKKGDPNALEKSISTGVFWLLMLLVIVAVLETIGLSQAAAPLTGLVDTVVQALPLLAKATLILVVAWAIGTILSKVVSKAIAASRLDKRFAELGKDEDGDGEPDAAAEARPFSESAGLVVFWLIMLFGLAGAVDALQIEAVAGPLSNVVDTLMGLIPAIGIAAAIAVVGWVLAKIVRKIVSSLLESLGFDRLMAKVKLDGLFGESKPSAVVGWLAMAFVILQTAIAALDRLGLPTLSEPLTEMMHEFWAILPPLFVSVAFVVLGVFVGRLLRGIVSKALASIGFDRFLAKLGFEKILDREDELGKPSGLVGGLVQGVIVLLALVQGFNNLGLELWAGYVDAFLTFAVTKAVVALAIILVGFAIGGWVRDLIAARQSSGEAEVEVAEGEVPPAREPNWIAEFARYAVLVFAFPMAVAQLGVAPQFVLISFGLLFGALCLAMALAFGLGSRELAGELVRKRYQTLEREQRAKGAAKPGGPFAKGPGVKL